MSTTRGSTSKGDNKRAIALTDPDHLIYLALPSGHGLEAGPPAGFVDQDGPEGVLVESSRDHPEHILTSYETVGQRVVEFEVKLKLKVQYQVDVRDQIECQHRTEVGFQHQCQV